MTDWGLVLAGPVGALARKGQLQSLTRLLRAYKAQAEAADNRADACRHLIERRHIVEEFLEDPGYADENVLRKLHEVAPDALTASELVSYLLGPWIRHCKLRLAETLLHLTVIVQTGILLGWLWSGAILLFPQLAEALLSAWVLLLYADLIWTMYASRVAKPGAESSVMARLHLRAAG